MDELIAAGRACAPPAGASPSCAPARAAIRAGWRCWPRARAPTSRRSWTASTAATGRGRGRGVQPARTRTALERARAAGHRARRLRGGDHRDRAARDGAHRGLARGARRRAWSCSPASWSSSAAEFLAPLPDGGSSTCTRRCCPPSPGCTRSSRRSSYGVRVFGVTVHFVDEGVDSGPIILQRGARAVRMLATSTAIGGPRPRVEHDLLPQAVRLIARGAMSIDPANPRRVLIDAEASPAWSSASAPEDGARPLRQPGEVRGQAGAAVGLRQARRWSSSRAGWPTWASRSSPPAARRASWRGGHRGRARSRTSPASPRSWTAGSRRCTPSSTPGCCAVRDEPRHLRDAERAGHRVRRPGVREPLPVRAHGRPARRRATPR